MPHLGSSCRLPSPLGRCACPSSQPPGALVLSTCGLSGPHSAHPCMAGPPLLLHPRVPLGDCRGAVLRAGFKRPAPHRVIWTSDLTPRPHLQSGVMLPTLWGCCERADEGPGLNPPAPHLAEQPQTLTAQLQSLRCPHSSLPCWVHCALGRLPHHPCQLPPVPVGSPGHTPTPSVGIRTCVCVHDSADPPANIQHS